MNKPCAAGAALARVDSNILNMSYESESWATNRPALVSSPEMAELKHFLKLLIVKTITSPASYDVATGITAPFLHFTLDLQSLLELDLLGDKEAAVVGAVVLRHGPSHREQYIGESAMAPERNLVDLARAIDKVAKVTSREDLRVLNDLILENIRPAVMETTAARQILKRKIQSVICRVLIPLAQRGRGGGYLMFLKLFVSCIDLCRGATTQVSLAHASKLVVADGRNGFLLPEKLNFYDESLPWTEGFAPTVMPDSAKYSETALTEFLVASSALKRVNSYNEFATMDDFESREKFERALTALGRGIGLACRYNGKVKEILNLQESLFKLFTEGDLNRLAEDLNLTDQRTAEALLRRVFEPVFFIQRGMEDVLGPARICNFSPFH